MKFKLLKEEDIFNFSKKAKSSDESGEVKEKDEDKETKKDEKSETPKKSEKSENPQFESDGSFWESLKAGFEEEKEHLDSVNGDCVAIIKIVLDHLKKDINYYKVEKKEEGEEEIIDDIDGKINDIDNIEKDVEEKKEGMEEEEEEKEDDTK